VSLPPPSASSTCLVTGASSGIGADIARELANRGHGVTLVARREERLRELADELQTARGVRVEPIACDLTDAADRDRLVSEVDERGLTVAVLVNNAGFGSDGRFQDLDADSQLTMVRTNVEAVVALCAVYVPRMVERGSGAILNVASAAGFHPFPGRGTYAASKAFVLSFTEALHEDLHNTGVTATALSPGPVPTEFQKEAGIEDEFKNVPSFAVLTSADAAAAGVRGLERGRRNVVPGVLAHVASLAGRYVPRRVLLPAIRRSGERD
jgi:short-subunit dehydrogenase